MPDDVIDVEAMHILRRFGQDDSGGRAARPPLQRFDAIVLVDPDHGRVESAGDMHDCGVGTHHGIGKAAGAEQASQVTFAIDKLADACVVDHAACAFHRG